MEQASEKIQLLLRLALCGGGAALLYGGATRLSALEELDTQIGFDIHVYRKL